MIRSYQNGACIQLSQIHIHNPEVKSEQHLPMNASCARQGIGKKGLHPPDNLPNPGPLMKQDNHFTHRR